MKPISPVIKNTLYAAIVIYVVGTCFILSGLLERQGRVEHFLTHHGYDGKLHIHE